MGIACIEQFNVSCSQWCREINVNENKDFLININAKDFNNTTIAFKQINIHCVVDKIPSNKMFGYISSEEEDEDLIFDINDVIQFNKNIKNLGKVETDMPSLGLYQLNSIYILQLNSDQDTEYFISK